MQPKPGGGASGHMNYDDAFEMTGRGPLSYWVLAASCLIFNHAVLEMVAIGYIITPAECDLNLTVFEKSMVNSAIYMGIMATCIIWGEVTDHFGRRRVMLPCVFGVIVTSFISSLCNTFWPMFIFRLLTGCLISAPSATVFVYLGELQVSAFRDVSISIAVTSSQFLFIFLPGIAWAIIPGTWSFNIGLPIKPWRVFMWTWSLIGLSGGVILLRLPESPNFVMTKKGPDEVLPILAYIYAMNHKTTPADFPVSSIQPKPEHDSNFIKELLQLVKPPMLRCFLLSHYCMFITFALANGLYIWLPDFINEVLSNINVPYSMCDLINIKYLKAFQTVTPSDIKLDDEIEELSYATYQSCHEGVNIFLYPTAIVMEIFALIPYVFVNIYIHKVNKTKIYVVIMLVNSISLVLCSVIPNMACALAFFILGLWSGCCCSLLSALAIDSFPTTLRGLAMCTMYCAGHLGAIAGNSIINGMWKEWCYVLFILLAAMASSSGLLLFFLWPDLDKVKAEMEARNYTY